MSARVNTPDTYILRICDFLRIGSVLELTGNELYKPFTPKSVRYDAVVLIKDEHMGYSEDVIY